MPTNLTIGLIGSIKGWNTILTQEGLPFKVISSPDNMDPNKFPLLILDSMNDLQYKKPLYNYLNSGGTLLISCKIWKSYFNGISHTRRIKYIQPNNLDLFSNIGLIDIYSDIEVPSDISLKLIDANLSIYEKYIGSGKMVIYPFDLPELMTNFRNSRKRFMDNRKELPSEIVATVSKNKIRQIMVACIQYLFKSLDIPLVSVWYYQKKRGTIFVFRVDTDFCTKTNAELLYKICKKYNIPGTWFLDTSNEDMLKSNYKKMVSQELALHCNRHKVFNNEILNRDNIQTGLKLLNKAGIKVIGFAAPYGDWNPSLANSISSFKYSSEFSLDYDNFPFYPYINDKISNVLQIPIHPISIGRLKRSHYSENEMADYYINIMKNKIQNNDPIIIYFHPENNHFEVLEIIFQWINDKNIDKYSMSAFADWWKNRLNIYPNYEFSKQEEKIISPKQNVQDYYLKINYRNSYTIIKSHTTINLQQLNWEQDKSISYSNNLSRIRKFNWRDLLHNYESKKARERL